MTVGVVGARQFRRDLRAIDEKANKKYAQINRDVAKHVQRQAKTNAGLAGGAYARAKSSITRSASVSAAAVGVRDSNRTPFAEATFWGALRRSGWYSQAKYAQSAGRQFPDWVGNTWEAARFDQGPYVINYTVAEEVPEIVKIHGDGIEAVFKEAFND